MISLRHTVVRLTLLLAGLWLAAGAQADLTAISDHDMSSVTGQEGASLELELDINATNGSPISGCGAPSTTGTADACRIALQFANRLGNGSTTEQWLVYKDTYGRLFIPNMFIDAATTPTSHSVPTTTQATVLGTTGTVTTATSYANLSVFKDGSGNCLLNCQGGTTPNPYGMPALQISMRNGDATGGAVSTWNTDNISTFDPTVSISLTIGGLSVEYGTAGYSANTTGSFQGMKIGDVGTASNVTGSPNYGGARIDFSGRVLVFGF